MSNKVEKSIDNKCPACSAPIKFKPSENKWVCEYCKSSFTLDEMKKRSNNASSKEKHSDEDTYDEYMSYRCKDCGAEIIADKDTTATFCVYCGNTAILKSKLSGKFKPDLIIPFKVEKTKVNEEFAKLLKGRPLMPRDFCSQENIEKIKGVYIPFWLYDFDYSGDVHMSGKKVSHWSVGDTHYTKTSIFNVVRGGNVFFEKIPVDGSTKFDNAVMNTIEPFDYKDMVEYNHAYLSGFYAEKYDQDSNDTMEEAKSRALNTCKAAFYNDVKGYNSLTVLSDDLKIDKSSIKYALFPVWMVNVKYKDKLYLFAMNGQTGEFIGDIPIDRKRVLVYSIIIFIIILIITFIVSYLIYKGGN